MKPALGVCYYPEHWPQHMWADDAARMVASGISHVRIAEFAWSRIEPARDAFDWQWLDEAIETLAGAGLKLILCTPTATPPRWLVAEMPDMLAVDREGRPRNFGSRRHYSFSHEGYRKEAARITEMAAKRYGEHPSVVAWQTDNEYGCHDTTISYCDASRQGFRDWLAQKYQSPEALNRAWGNVFWSMEVADFSQIDLPNLTVTEANPAHWLDFRRFSSDQVVAFNRIQAGILRRHSPGRDIVHNFMGKVVDFDHFDVSVDLDVASWDSYPIGFLEQFGRDNAWKNWYMRAGDPDFQAFHHDLYRACGTMRDGGTGRWWVMEQQPGPVNWAPWNPDPHPGMVRLWTHEAFAHGAELVSYFRWRQAPFAQEQMHTGLNRPDNAPDRALAEIEQVARELTALPETLTEKARVALIVDYPSWWATMTQPQGADFDGFELTLAFYQALRQQGQSIDIVPTNGEFSNYALIIVPQVLFADETLVRRLSESGAEILIGPRFGSRTKDHAIPDNLPPGPLQAIVDCKVTRVESLRPGAIVPAEDGGFIQRWFEHLDVGDAAEILERDGAGRPLAVRQARCAYFGGWPDEALMHRLVREALARADLPFIDTGDDLRIRDKGNLRTIINYGPKPQDASHLIGPGDEVMVGGPDMAIAGVTIVRRRPQTP